MESMINHVRDTLRNEGITGMDSINHCIVFIICRMLNEKICKKTKIDPIYAYENIMQDDDGDEIGDQELYSRFYIKGDTKCLVGQLVNKLGFKNIKFKLEGIHNLKNIMKKLRTFNPQNFESNYDIIGTIYEIHLKSGTSNARDLGQYYTHRLVINYMIKLCDPLMEKGIVEKIVDPTMGTGGFLTMAIRYLNAKYKNKIDWAKNKSNIIGFDIDENVRNMALLNVFLEIGELCENTLVKEDTLHNDLRFSDGRILEKAKIILANEPMGLKNIIHASCCDRIKNCKIRGTKAELLFLQLFMELLDDNGRCAVVVPDGVLVNDSALHNNTRKHLIENFNLKKIVSLNGNFFLNTGVKTSIIFFTKDGNKTSHIEFCELKLKNNSVEEAKIIDVPYDKIVSNEYTLFVNKYDVKTTDKLLGMKYAKINDVCEISFGKRIKKVEVEIDDDYTGIKYPCYGGGDISFYMKEFNREGQNLIISRFGISETCVRLIDCKFWLNDSGFTLKTKSGELDQNYLNYIMLNKQKEIYNMSFGSCQKNINMDDFKKMEIPLPDIKIQENIVRRCHELERENIRMMNLIKKNELEVKNTLIEYIKKNADDNRMNDNDSDDSDDSNDSDDSDDSNDSDSGSDKKPVNVKNTRFKQIIKKKVNTTKKIENVYSSDSTSSDECVNTKRVNAITKKR